MSAKRPEVMAVVTRSRAADVRWLASTSCSWCLRLRAVSPKAALHCEVGVAHSRGVAPLTMFHMAAKPELRPLPLTLWRRGRWRPWRPT
eukprot:11150627-Lingulodinium_polyedra.AAC.1